MHDTRFPTPPEPVAVTASFGDAQGQTQAIVADAMATRVAVPAPRRRSGDSMRLLGIGLLALVAVGALAAATGMVQLGGPNDDPATGGANRDNTYSYYHDADYKSQDNGAKWATDPTRSTDPDQAALGDTSRWEYDGSYRYGSYGSDGMSQRAKGTSSRDPLYSEIPDIGDVFSASGDLDPSGGEPIGTPPSNLTTPYYDPYAGYANPYANRIRLAYGEGYGSGASSTVQPSRSPLTSP